MDWSSLLPVIVSAILGWFLRHRGVGATWFGGGGATPNVAPTTPNVAPLDDVARALEEDRRRHVERQQRKIIDALREAPKE